MQIALQGLSADEQSKMERILAGMAEKDANFGLLESSCFSEDMTTAGFSALDLWKSYEHPFYDGISPKDAKFTKPILDSYHAIVSLLLFILCCLAKKYRSAHLCFWLG
jgi:hypothetical protein